MGFKDNISMVKDELSSEEKFFANAIRIESFVTKYKTLLIILGIVIILAIIAGLVNNYENARDVKLSNIAFLQLKHHPNNIKALHVLKDDNINLYNIFLLKQAVQNNNIKLLLKLSNVKTLFVSDLASYQLASLQKSRKKLRAYENRNNALYKQIAVLQNAYLLIKKHKMTQAHEQLQTISPASPINHVAKILAHYGIK